jgi:hypothetical protein
LRRTVVVDDDEALDHFRRSRCGARATNRTRSGVNAERSRSAARLATLLRSLRAAALAAACGAVSRLATHACALPAARALRHHEQTPRHYFVASGAAPRHQAPVEVGPPVHACKQP